MARNVDEAGFSLIELMVAMVVLTIGSLGITKLLTTSFWATSFARRATEATVLGGDKLEALRTIPVASLTSGQERVNEQGAPSAEGHYVRRWTVTPQVDGTTQVTVVVSWSQDGAEPRAFSFRTIR